MTRFWSGEAAKLIAPLLRAAAAGPGQVAAVLGWLDAQDVAGTDRRRAGRVGAPRGRAAIEPCRPPLPTLRLVLDEVANIAPLEDLARHLAQAAGNGVRVATIWQSIAQMRDRFGQHAAGEILQNSQAKLFMGSITDEATRCYLVGLLGEERVETTSRSESPEGFERERTHAEAWRSRASAQALQQLADGRALLVHGTLPPAIVRLAPFWTSGRWRGQRSDVSRGLAEPWPSFDPRVHRARQAAAA